MPCAEQPQYLFSCYLETVEHLISRFKSDGPLIVVGDLNAHLGSRDPEVKNACNGRGLEWNTIIHTYFFHNVSLGCLSSGPTYTYSSCGNISTFDYVIANQDAARGINTCVTLEDHPLNTSDHIPVTCSYPRALHSQIIPAFSSQILNWAQGETSLSTINYAKSSDDIARPFLLLH